VWSAVSSRLVIKTAGRNTALTTHEDRGVGADAQAERNDGDRREAGLTHRAP